MQSCGEKTTRPHWMGEHDYARDLEGEEWDRIVRAWEDDDARRWLQARSGDNA